MIALPNGCRCSNLTVHPSNWKTKKASVSINWYISYRFYDPRFPKPKQCIIKGMNEFKNLEERREITAGFLSEELNLLVNQSYNPITGECQEKEEEQFTEIYPTMPLIPALKKAIELMEVGRDVKIDLRSVVKYFEKAAVLVRRDDMPLELVKRKDIKLILANCQKVKELEKRVWSDNQFNQYRSHLSMIFNYLMQEDIVEYNPIEKIPKKTIVREPREVLTNDQRKKIDLHLKQNQPLFHRYVHIFFHSGARRAELLRLQGSHVDLQNQRYRVLINKRKTKTWVWKTIKDVALPFWIEAMKGCAAEDYVFSVGLKPGKRKIRPEQVTRRWRRYVKGPIDQGGLGIAIDFYSLKHLHTTEVMDIIEGSNEGENAVDIVAEHNSHTSGAMVVKIYDVKSEERKHRKVKGIRNSFA